MWIWSVHHLRSMLKNPIPYELGMVLLPWNYHRSFQWNHDGWSTLDQYGVLGMDVRNSKILKPFLLHENSIVEWLNVFFSTLTLPIIGNSTEPQVSAAQWTKPEPKSAVIMPQQAAQMIRLKFSNCKWYNMKRKLTTISVIQIPTQIHSCVRFPENKLHI